MESAGTRTRLKFMGRISLEHVASAVRKVRSMTIAQKTAILDEIQVEQPNLLASCVVQVRLGADDQTVEFLLNLLLTCYVSMRESGFEWPLISGHSKPDSRIET